MSIHDKYKPKKIDDFFISKNYKNKLTQYIRVTKGKKPLIIYGNRGVGKTTLAEVVLKEFGITNVIIVDKNNFNKVLENIQKYSLFGENGYIIENLDELPENKQLTIFKKFLNAGVKFIITAIDLYRLHYYIRKNSETFHLYNPNPNLLKKLVVRVLNDYNLSVPKSVIDKLVETHPHDIRALLTDLQVLINIGDWRLFMRNYNVRNYRYNLFTVLESYFNSKTYTEAVKSFMSFPGDQIELIAHITDNIITSTGNIKNKIIALKIVGEAMRFRIMGIQNKMKTWSVSFYSMMLVPELYRKNKLKINKLQTSKAVFEFNKNAVRLSQMKQLIDKIKKTHPQYNTQQSIELLELYADMLNSGEKIRSMLQREYGFTKNDIDLIIEIFS